MPPTIPERYVVVSCHVERLLDDAVWAAFDRLVDDRPGGLAVAALVRPADPSAGEDEERWFERARSLATRVPFGHHTHWTSPGHARPTATGEVTGERVLREGRRLVELGLAPTLFCGGGWYTDASVAAACAELGYADCTLRATRPGYLPADAPWAEHGEPALVQLADDRLLRVLPTTHTAGDGLRAALGSGLQRRIHVYFHDTDLVDARRARIVRSTLGLLGRRRPRHDLDELSGADPATLPTVDWATVVRGRPAESEG